MKDERSNSIKIILGVFAVLMSLTVFIAGCTQTPTEGNNAMMEGHDEDPLEEEEHEEEHDHDEEDHDAETDTHDVEMQREDTKTEEEKAEDQVMNMLEDGVHVAEVSYSNPSGVDTMEVSITTENDVITAVSLTPVGEPHKVSLDKINAVNGALPELVVGKNIADIQLPNNVAGSSLTTAAVQKHIESLTA